MTSNISKICRLKPGHTEESVYLIDSKGLYYAEMTMDKWILSIFCRMKSNSPGKLIVTVVIHFVHESFINVASDSSPGSDGRPASSDEEGCVLLPLPGLLALGQGHLFALQPASVSFG